ncbi:hypothetical protein D3C83_168340 [compost metagenome]
MGEVIGYFGSEEERHVSWVTMRNLRESAKKMYRRDPIKYKRAIEYQNNISEFILSEYLTGKVA